MTATAWITATPPTPNGDLHVGHLAGPYVAADVLRRHLAAREPGAMLSTGLDDHQSYVAVRALRDGRTASDVADDYGRRIVSSWKAAGVCFDRVGWPRADPGYRAFVQRFFLGLAKAGVIVQQEQPLPYCDSCDRWLYEAYLRGFCPHCGSESNGNACEACARPNQCHDLIDPRCVICGGRAKLAGCERSFFPLAPFAERLSRFWSETCMPPRLHVLCETMLEQGLPDVAVSHPGDWGLEIGYGSLRGQRIYVWLEMACGYLLEQDEGAAPPARGPIQFFGFDNGYFHAVLIPALLMAFDRRIPLPEAFVVNEFYLLEGEKFSTSRNHAVWAPEALAVAGSDVLRFHLLAGRPNGRKTNFDLAGLAETSRRLNETWDRWLNQLLISVAENCGGRMPDEPPEGAAWEALMGTLDRTEAELEQSYAVATFDARRIVALLDMLVADAVEFGYVFEHERARADSGRRYRAALAAQLIVAARLAAWCGPVLPGASRRLAKLLGYVDLDRAVAGDGFGVIRGPAPGTPMVVPGQPTFSQ